MRFIFADTSYWIAILSPRDQLKAKAEEISQGLGEHRMVTSEMVLTEILDHLCDKGQHLREATVNIVQRIMSNPNIDVVPQASVRFHEALHHYRGRPDKKWSLTDCSSFLIMQERGIEEALTSDHDFEQAGYRALLMD
ncbi:PIN domain-containing protein [bacterium]|nr:PIN domain-containing protein [bacterium]